MTIDRTDVFSQDRVYESFRVPFDHDVAVQRLAGQLDAVFLRSGARPIAIVCVGTDRSTGDSFGPLVGSKLMQSATSRAVRVYGSLDEPVHAVNLSSVLQQIRGEFREPPFILAIDACLGKFDHVGHIILEEGPLRPGAGVKKELPEFGDFTLTGVVNVCGFMEYFVLQNTRLSIVVRMSEVVSEAIRVSLHRMVLQRHLLGAAYRM